MGRIVCSPEPTGREIRKGRTKNELGGCGSHRSQKHAFPSSELSHTLRNRFFILFLLLPSQIRGYTFASQPSRGSALVQPDVESGALCSAEVLF